MSKNEGAKAEYFLGTIVEIVDPVLYQVKVDIPGVFEGITAFPIRGEIDEPKVGDFVLLRSFDPVYHSYFIYQKLKENDFIGFRSNGKMVDITPDYIKICTFDSNSEFTDGKEGSDYRPVPQDWIKLDSSGKMEAYLRSDFTAIIKGSGTITVDGDIKIVSNSSVTIQAPNVTIKGPGTLECKGTVIPSAEGGPFCAVKVAPPPGTPMISGSKMILS